MRNRIGYGIGARAERVQLAVRPHRNRAPLRLRGESCRSLERRAINGPCEIGGATAAGELVIPGHVKVPISNPAGVIRRHPFLVSAEGWKRPAPALSFA